MPATDKRPLKVFLCHASADKPKVRELYRYLKRRGIQPWFDEKNLMGGQDWQIEIPKALLTSDAIIICLTNNSVNKEGYVQKEIKFALDKALEIPAGRIYLIPVRFEDCEVPVSLSHYHWIDLFEKKDFAKLMKSLRARAAQLDRMIVELSESDETNPYSAVVRSKKTIGYKSVISDFVSGITKTFSETFNALGTKHPNITPFLKASIIVGSVAVIVFWIILFARSKMSPLAIAGVTSSPSTTLAFTDSPAPMIGTQKTSITPSQSVTPTPTFTLTLSSTDTPLQPTRTTVSLPTSPPSTPTWTSAPSLEGPSPIPTVLPTNTLSLPTLTFTPPFTATSAQDFPTNFLGSSVLNYYCSPTEYVDVEDGNGISKVEVYWENGADGWRNKEMELLTGDSFSGHWSTQITFTGYPDSGVPQKYFVATDTLGNTAQSVIYSYYLSNSCP